MKEVTIKKLCECGGEIEYIQKSGMLASHPPQYQHKCNKCDKRKNYFLKYPYSFIEFDQQEQEIRYEEE